VSSSVFLTAGWKGTQWYGKSQQTVAFSCLLTDIGNIVYSSGQSIFVIDVHVKNIFDA